MAFADKPVALMGFGTDVRTMKSEVVAQSRYASVTFENKWIDPADYGKYSVIYVGEKLRGEARGKSWREGAAREAIEKFIADGGIVIVGGRTAMTELFGKPGRKKPDTLREKVIFIDKSLGRMIDGYAKAKKPLSFPDDAGNDILTDEGRAVKAVQDKYIEAFAKAKDVERLPEGEKWEAVPLGEPGNLQLPKAFPKRPKLGRARRRPRPVRRRAEGGHCAGGLRRGCEQARERARLAP